MDTYVRDYESQSYSFTDAYTSLIRKVYVWMTLALVMTGLSAYYVASSPSLTLAIFSNSILFYGLMIAEVGLVIWLSARIYKMSLLTATLMFSAYAILNGVTMSCIFLAYTMSSIATTFFVTAGTFGVMALVGSVTKTDLTKMGQILLMALIGVIIASLVNIFLGNGMLDIIISVVGILIFTGLTAYDAQKIKQMLINCNEVNDQTQKLSVIGALSLYLDFINLFLYLLRFLGDRK
ncbi:MAG: Bax inhibitor-1/YccA family protein [Bacteroidaceae bacterium]|nr:Bax inhibitor-1/YccA family protein [Bacteroidaceae bacterium]